ncbi:hypothetical protein L202_08352 [Cryptococcus amylolentus CBS 6039]|uniref:Uncharacterized protein n=2 Tax=Cryptococcus amylolentus TaxID=104669 RepID=A0A1E3HAZ7_9TREE|nr:hypothetical protein L202_08352 [Cryptococcus amylolentus CBS 6039]ODN72946.1 hypothetical protein L202_08352 [Cryptococcus amylolentus CBS 6039]ODN98113.1 hypothetical protein I350_07755 [Cryptococcus amylolentus CBS 6273]
MPSTELPWVLANPILIHTPAVAAVGAASCDSLRIWRAVSALPRDATTGDTLTHSPPTSPSPSVFRQWRAHSLRTKARKVLTFIFALAIFLAIEFVIVVLVPKISSRMIRDGFFASVWIFIYTRAVKGILSLVKPLPSQVHYESKTPDAPVRLVISPVENTNDGLWPNVLHHGLPIAGSIGIVALVAYGHTAHLPLVGAVLIWTYFSNIRINRLKMGSIILIMLGVLSVSCIVVGGVFAVLWGLGTWNDEPNKKPPLEDSDLSDWVTNLTAFFQCLISLTYPGLIITMTYRFEYSQLANQLTLAEDDQDKEDSFSGVTSVAPVCIPVDYPSFPCPITITSLLSLLLCLAAMDLALGKNIEYVSPFPALVAILVVPFFTAVAAAQQGKFGEWWRYQETWVPPKQDDAGQASKNGPDPEPQDISSGVAYEDEPQL